MEPFHQLRFSRDAGVDIVTELELLGISVTQKDDSWIGRNHADFHDLICERDGARTVFAVGPDRSDDAFTLMVYVSMLDDHLTANIRVHLESRGAEWGYFDW
ncbi:MAG: hypothetical protein K8T91_04630 [Planctomycetes bacterium]|nr:hypothetical protein [Planctomycetota bacterium]